METFKYNTSYNERIRNMMTNNTFVVPDCTYESERNEKGH